MHVDQAVAAYRDQGYARLGQLLDPAELQRYRARALALMRGEIVHEGMFFQLDAATGRYEDAPLGLGWQGPSERYRKVEKLERDELFQQLIAHPKLAPLVRALLPALPIRLYRAILFNKSAQGSSEIPWHQDGGKLWGLSEEPQVQVWVALDDAPEDGGCLEVVPGTHRSGTVTPLGGVIPEARVGQVRVEPLPARAGEAILLHNHLWHRSGRSKPGQRRIGYSACYLGPHVRCVRKKKTPRTFYEVWKDAPAEV